jgi:GNAT superfamily N-acetyltransferase
VKEPSGLILEWLTHPEMVTPALLTKIARCWQEVSNAGGAVGFPFPPVEIETVMTAAEEMVGSLNPLLRRLLIATVDDTLAGWLFLSGNENPLTSHWAYVQRVQTDLAFRGSGVGRALMAEVSRAAGHEFGLRALNIEVRGGAGLEGFYRNLGWTEIGRWPGSLRFGPEDYRDNVLMSLSLCSE